MVGPSKILTVSYGTFSCTLEGFDDPFSTMRGIAEYFRDLAADDRYFGAEPPTPDAEMLHNIAQREVQRRVESQIDDNGITLRQLDETVVARSAPEPAPVSGIAEPAVAAIHIAAAADITPEPQGDTAPVTGESVAAKLARIRAVVSDDASADVTAYQDDELVDEALATTPISAAFEDVIEDDDSQEAAPETQHADEEAVEPEPEVEEEIEEVAITLETEAEADVNVEIEPEVETAPEFAAEVSEDHEISEIAEITDEDTAEEEAVVEATNDDTNADADPIILSADDNDEATEEHATGEVGQDEPEEQDLSDDEDGQAAETAVGRIMAAVSVSQPDVDDHEEDAIEASDEPDHSAVARVVKMRRSDFEAAVADGDIEEITEPDMIEEVALPESTEDTQSSLSPEDEAELMSNLEQVQREAEAERRADKEGRAILENKDIEEDTNSMSRILEVTNSEMQESEGTRRRSAIAHLKAAVAATRADKLLAKKRAKDEADELDQYRNDLARVVRPKRPPEAGKATERRMAPLMLVSEQRIDAPEPDPISAAAAAVVRPRRVSSVNLAMQEDDDHSASANGEENIFRDAGSFAEFAEDVGASELPDLLEAAAAYYSFVEGHAHFSRPQIMKAVASLDEEKEYSREEGLRSFGMLLRRGKIQKIKRGQFKVSSSSRFNPVARAAGE